MNEIITLDALIAATPPDFFARLYRTAPDDLLLTLATGAKAMAKAGVINNLAEIAAEMQRRGMTTDLWPECQFRGQLDG